MIKKYISEIIKPLKFGKMNYLLFFSSLIVESTMFPLNQILLGLTQKYLVNAVEYNDFTLMRYVYILSGIMFLCFFIIHPLTDLVKCISVNKFTQRLQNKALIHTYKLSAEYFDKTHSGYISSYFNNDLKKIPNMYKWTMNRLLLAVFYGLGSFILMLNLYWQLALVILFLGIIETYIIIKTSKAIKKNSDFIQEKLSISNERFLDIVNGLKIIRMFSISKLMLKKYSEINEDIRDETMKKSKTALLTNALNDLFAAVNLIGILSLGLILYINNHIDLGTVMAFIIVQDGISYMYFNIAASLPDVHEHIAVTERVFKLLEIEVPSVPAVIKKSENKIDYTITCNNISFAYDDTNKYAIKNFTCEFSMGKTYAIVGKSGTGKSTLLKLILGLYKPNDGHILIGNVDYSILSSDDIAKHISYVSQDSFLFNDTIAQNIRFGNPNASYNDIANAAIKANIHDLIKSLPDKYNTIIYENGNNVSGGQKQRIALARAFLKDAPIFILDEATTGVDSQSELFIKASIRDLKLSGKTVIIVAHRISLIKEVDIFISID